MSTSPEKQQTPSIRLCIAVFLCVCLAVGLFNWLTTPRNAVTLHKAEAATAAPWIMTPSPSPEVTATPEATPTPEATVAPEATPTSAPAQSTAASPAPDATGTWVLNTRSKRFHLPECSSVPTIKESNRSDFTGPREELIEQGYKPCGSCKP